MTFSFYRFFFFFYFSGFPASLIAFFCLCTFSLLLFFFFSLTVFLSSPFLIFSPYFPPHAHLAPEPEEIYSPSSPSFLIPSVRAISFHISRISMFFFLEKKYIYIYLISAIFYIAQQMNASNSNSSQNYNLERKFIYIRRNIVDVRK